VLYFDSIGSLVIDRWQNYKRFGKDSVLQLIKQGTSLVKKENKEVRYLKVSAEEIGLYIATVEHYKYGIIFTGESLSTLDFGGEGCEQCVASQTDYYLHGTINDTLLFKAKDYFNYRTIKILRKGKKLTVFKHDDEVLKFKLSTRI